MPLKSKVINEFVTASYKKNKDADPKIGNYELDRSLSTGKAKVYHDPIANKTIVANRGTTGTLSDWKNNLSYITGQYDKTERLKQAENVQDEAIKKYGKVDTNITHSQSAIIGRKLNQKGKTGQVIEVNPAIMFEKQKKNEYIIKSTYDPVSALTNINPFLKKENVYEINADSINPLKEHSADILQRVDTEYGTGMKLGFNNITSDSDIDEMLYHISNYKGCFVKDELPKELENGFYVVNLNGQSHWCALQKEGDIYFWFDSYGFPAPIEVIDRIDMDSYFWNEIQIQDLDSTACGYYCVAYVFFMNQKMNPFKSFVQFCKLFNKDTNKNDKILKVLLTKYL